MKHKTTDKPTDTQSPDPLAVEIIDAATDVVDELQEIWEGYDIPRAVMRRLQDAVERWQEREAEK